MTMVMPLSLVSLTVERSEPELIVPAKPTPYEFKNLSDKDSQKILRKQAPVIHFYQGITVTQGIDPVKVIKNATAEALVFYYPFAGRLREGSDGTLMVECTGEGIMFVEARANARLDQLGGVPHPPFHGVEDLLFDVPGSSGILNCPLLLIQVTRFVCGGFTFAVRLNHTMSDAVGLGQFMTAVAEIARGASAPSIHPVWKRQLLNARDRMYVSPVHPSCDGRKREPVDDDDMVQRGFLFSLEQIVALKTHLPSHLGICSKFDVLTALLWKSRTIALELKSDDVVRLGFLVNARAKFNPPLPVGYYGNATGMPIALTTAGELSDNPLWYAVSLIRRAKKEVTDEFMRSAIDSLVKKGCPDFTSAPTYYVSDLTNIKGFSDLDFGWGKPIFGGATGAYFSGTFLQLTRNKEGTDGIVATVNLPGPVMERLSMEIEKILGNCGLKQEQL